MSWAYIQGFLDLDHVVNVLHNGNFNKIPFVFNSKKLTFATGIFTAETVTWEKSRERNGLYVKKTKDYVTVPSWTVWSDVDNGVLIDFNPIDTTTGLRLWSKEGGNVLYVEFTADTTLYLEQEVNGINQFPMQEMTASLSLYPLKQGPTINVDIDYGTQLETILTAYSGNTGDVYRVTEVTTCRGDMTKMSCRLRVSGKAGEKVGISGINICLGSYMPVCPYADNPVEHTFDSGSIVFYEGDRPPQGFSDLGANCYFYQTYGDATNQLCAPDNIDELELWTMQDKIGEDYHNWHYSTIPYLSTGLGWFWGEAIGVSRIKNFDWNDRGCYRYSGGTWTKKREMNLYYGLVDGSYMNENLVGWTKFSFNRTSPVTGPNEVNLSSYPLTVGGLKDVMIQDAANHTKMLEFLPGTAGKDWDSGTMAWEYLHYWEQKHLHYVYPIKDKVDPPYRSFRACMKQ